MAFVDGQAIGGGCGEAGHRRTTRPGEIVRLVPVQPTEGEPLTGYTLDTAQPNFTPGGDAPTLTNSFTGASETPASSFSLSDSASASNPVDETVYQATHGTSTQHLYHSRRGLQVTRWRTVLGAPYNIDEEWMSRNAVEGIGRSMGWNERHVESLNETHAMASNPTMGGTHLEPHSANDDLTDLWTSVPLHDAAAGGAAGTAYSEAAGVPLQFDADGENEETQGPYIDAPASRAILWWRQKQYGRVDPHYGSREFIHRITQWYFQPRRWDQSEFGGGVGSGGSARFQFGRSDAGVRCRPLFDAAYFFDCSTGTLTTLSFSAAGAPATWEANDSALMYFQAVSAPDDPSPFASGYAAAILRRTSDDFCIALAMKISGDGNNIGTISRETLPISLTIKKTGLGANPSPVYDTGPAHNLTSNCRSFFGREAGWSGSVGYLYTGPWSQCQTALQELYSSGVLDESPNIRLIPSSITPGTDIVSFTSAGASVGGAEWNAEVQSMTATTLWLAVVAAYNTTDLVSLTNLRDPSATSINTSVGENAAQEILDLWPLYTQLDFDETDAKHIAVGKHAVIALLWRRGGVASGIEQVTWERAVEMMELVKRVGPRGHRPPKKSGTGLQASPETTSGTVSPWSDKASLPPGVLPNRSSGESDGLP